MREERGSVQTLCLTNFSVENKRILMKNKERKMVILGVGASIGSKRSYLSTVQIPIQKNLPKLKQEL